jgi:hypothetical protein
MTTLQNIMDSVRVDLQDADAIRYPDPQLLEYCNDGIRHAFRIRPDFLLGGYNGTVSTYTASQEVPLDWQYVHLLKQYVAARAEFRDDEYSQDGRAAAFLQMFEIGMRK